MANNGGLHVPVDYGYFLEFLHSQNLSVRGLARELDIQDKSIRRSKETGKMPLSIALDICEKTGTTFSETFGKEVDPGLRELIQKAWK